MSKNAESYSMKSPVYSYLEFGSVDLNAGTKLVYDYRMHSKAYDWLMHARYSHDMYTYQRMIDALQKGNLKDVGALYSSEVHHKNDFLVNLNKKNALECAGNSFFELGQTLFGCIESIKFIKQLESYLNIESNFAFNLNDVSWYGVDISEFFNYMAENLHSNYQVSVSSNLDNVPEEIDVFFAKGITLLYAIDSAETLFNLVYRAKISVFDYSISLFESKGDYIGTGKAVKFLGHDEFQLFYEMVQQTGKEIWVRGNSKSTPEGDKFYLEGIIADYEMGQNFIKVQQENLTKLEKATPQLFKTLVHEKSPEYYQWRKFSEVL